MELYTGTKISRRDLLKVTGLATLALGTSSTPPGLRAVQAAATKTANQVSTGPYNILMVVTDQERYIPPSQLPSGYQLPGHERLAKRGVVFKNHQIASNVCTPSRAVLYTGKHIQNNGMFDNTIFPRCDTWVALARPGSEPASKTASS